MAASPPSTLIEATHLNGWDRILRDASDDDIARFLRLPWSIWRRTALEAEAAARGVA